MPFILYFSPVYSIEHLYKTFEEYRQQHTFSGQVQELYDPANYLMELGGKRMRPLLTLLAYQLSGKKIEDALPAALAIEVFHNFTLMHDDIMDASPLRRGQPTVHKKFNTNTAILSGDWMLIHSYALLNQYEAPLNKSLLALLNKTATEVCEGQQLDMNFESMTAVSESQYLHMIKNKTAVLLGAAMQMGGIIANASEKDLINLYAAGMNLGLSFQLRDDYLDAYSTESGKQIGGDIHQNKKTLLYIHSLGHATEEDKKSLISVYSQKNIDKTKQVLTLFAKTKSDIYVQNLADQYGKIAFDSLSQLSTSNETKQPLNILFQNLLIRKT